MTDLSKEFEGVSTRETAIQAIKSDSVYLEILKDSFGGIMYNVANKGKYDVENLRVFVKGLGSGEIDGITKGALSFVGLI